MSKKNRKKDQEQEYHLAELPPLQSKKLFFTDNLWVQLFAVVALCFALNWNSTSNIYCLDDDIILRQNIYVQRGFGGIGDIMTHDSYQSFYDVMNAGQQLENGRYRPLSAVAFAIEQDMFGKTNGDVFNAAKKPYDSIRRVASPDGNLFSKIQNEYQRAEQAVREANLETAFIHHFFNIVWLALSMVALLWFLRFHVFRSNTDIAFLAVLIFVAHPIHTEVIANVKSRDEIMSLLFVALTGIFIFRYDAEGRKRDLWLGLASLFLALLSKEYSLALPLILLTGIYILHDRFDQKLLRPVILSLAAVLPILMVMFLSENNITSSQAWFICSLCVGLPLLLRRTMLRSEEPSVADWIVPMFMVIGVYMTIRFAVIGHTTAVDLEKQSVLNDPFLFLRKGEAEGSEFATKVSVLIHYIRLLFVPHPLSSDYSYATYPYVGFSSPMFWLSFLFYGAMLWLGIRLFIKRHIMAFAFAIFFGFFVLVCNVFIPLGATMGERLIYHSSLGFIIIAAWGIITLADKIKAAVSVQRIAVTGISVVVLALMGMKTIDRNKDWYSDYTLFTTDVKTVPNSVLCNGNAGARYLDPGLMRVVKSQIEQRDLTHEDSLAILRQADSAMPYFNKALEYDPRYVNGLLNRGLCWYYKGNMEKAVDDWAAIDKIYPQNPMAVDYARRYCMLPGTMAGQIDRDFPKAIKYLTYAYRVNPGSAEIIQNLGGAYFTIGDFEKAQAIFAKGLELNPGDQVMTGGYNVAKNNVALKTKVSQDSLNPATWNEYGNALLASNIFEQAEIAYRKSLTLLPENNTVAKTGLDSVDARRKRADEFRKSLMKKPEKK